MNGVDTNQLTPMALCLFLIDEGLVEEHEMKRLNRGISKGKQHDS